MRRILVFSKLVLFLFLFLFLLLLPAVVVDYVDDGRDSQLHHHHQTHCTYSLIKYSFHQCLIVTGFKSCLCTMIKSVWNSFLTTHPRNQGTGTFNNSDRHCIEYITYKISTFCNTQPGLYDKEISV